MQYRFAPTIHRQAWTNEEPLRLSLRLTTLYTQYNSNIAIAQGEVLESEKRVLCKVNW
jgi:hypothetical protein